METKRKVQVYHYNRKSAAVAAHHCYVTAVPAACFVSKGKCVKDLIRGLTLGYAPIDSFHGLSNVQSIKPNVRTTGA